MTTAAANLPAADTVIVFRGFERFALSADQFIEADGFIRVLDTNETFELGQTAFRDEKEARQVARARVQRFCL